MEILQTIAMLCLTSGMHTNEASREQLKCQKYYITCLAADTNLTTYKTLAQCVKEKQ